MDEREGEIISSKSLAQVSHLLPTCPSPTVWIWEYDANNFPVKHSVSLGPLTLHSGGGILGLPDVSVEFSCIIIPDHLLYFIVYYAVYLPPSQHNLLSLNIPNKTLSRPLVSPIQAHSIIATTSHLPPPAHYYPYPQHHLNSPAISQAHYPSLHTNQSINYHPYHQSLYPTYVYPSPTTTSPLYPQQYHTPSTYHGPQP